MITKKLENLTQKDLEKGAYLRVGKKLKRILMVNLRDYLIRTDNKFPPTIYVCEPDTTIKVKKRNDTE